MKKEYTNKNGNLELTTNQGFGLTKITGGSKNQKHKVILLNIEAFDEDEEKVKFGEENIILELHITNGGSIEIRKENKIFENETLMNIVFNNKYKKNGIAE